MLIRDVNDAIDELHSEIDLRMGREELQCHRLQVESSECNGSRNRQIAAGRQVFAAYRFLSVPQILECPLTSCKEPLARLGHHDLTG
jgi:hypothetical protein